MQEQELEQERELEQELEWEQEPMSRRVVVERAD